MLRVQLLLARNIQAKNVSSGLIDRTPSLAHGSSHAADKLRASGFQWSNDHAGRGFEFLLQKQGRPDILLKSLRRFTMVKVAGGGACL